MPSSFKELVLMGLISGGMRTYNEMKAEREYQEALEEAGGKAGDVLANYGNPNMPQVIARPPQPWTGREHDDQIISRETYRGPGGTSETREILVSPSPEEYSRQQQQERINRDPVTQGARGVVQTLERLGEALTRPHQ